MSRPNAGKTAARASWIAPILLILIGYLLIDEEDGQATAVALTSIQVVLVLIGFGAAIYALASIKQFGWRGLVIPASIGLMLNTAYLALLGWGIYMLIYGSR